MAKARIATMWLDGCSGCHMSLLDMDERLIDVARQIELVYGPLVDAKIFPENVEVTLIEGAISSDEDEERALLARKNSKIIVALGDCAVTTNVPGMRNVHRVGHVLERVYQDNGNADVSPPDQYVPRLIERVRPLHEVIEVDVYVPGCPPPADAIHYVLVELLAGRTPDLTELTRFGA